MLFFSSSIFFFFGHLLYANCCIKLQWESIKMRKDSVFLVRSLSLVVAEDTISGPNSRQYRDKPTIVIKKKKKGILDIHRMNNFE